MESVQRALGWLLTEFMVTMVKRHLGAEWGLEALAKLPTTAEADASAVDSPGSAGLVKSTQQLLGALLRAAARSQRERMATMAVLAPSSSLSRPVECSQRLLAPETPLFTPLIEQLRAFRATVIRTAAPNARHAEGDESTQPAPYLMFRAHAESRAWRDLLATEQWADVHVSLAAIAGCVELRAAFARDFVRIVLQQFDVSAAEMPVFFAALVSRTRALEADAGACSLDAPAESRNDIEARLAVLPSPAALALFESVMREEVAGLRRSLRGYQAAQALVGGGRVSSNAAAAVPGGVTAAADAGGPPDVADVLAELRAGVPEGDELLRCDACAVPGAVLRRALLRQSVERLVAGLELLRAAAASAPDGGAAALPERARAWVAATRDFVWRGSLFDAQVRRGRLPVDAVDAPGTAPPAHPPPPPPPPPTVQVAAEEAMGTPVRAAGIVAAFHLLSCVDAGEAVEGVAVRAILAHPRPLAELLDADAGPLHVGLTFIAGAARRLRAAITGGGAARIEAGIHEAVALVAHWALGRQPTSEHGAVRSMADTDRLVQALALAPARPGAPGDDPAYGLLRDLQPPMARRELLRTLLARAGLGEVRRADDAASAVEAVARDAYSAGALLAAIENTLGSGFGGGGATAATAITPVFLPRAFEAALGELQVRPLLALPLLTLPSLRVSRGTCRNPPAVLRRLGARCC